MKSLFIILSLGITAISCQNNDIKISLAEWSLHKKLTKGEITNLEFPGIAKTQFNLDAVEFVNLFFKNKAEDTLYLQKLKDECLKHEVTPVLIMVDDEGNLGDTNQTKRSEAVKNHTKWIKAANFLGCKHVRVNASGTGNPDSVLTEVAKSLKELCVIAHEYNIDIIIENHWGNSSNGKWMVDLVKAVNMPNCGTLPDFGNFDTYDRYQGVDEMMEYAKDVSAKSYHFDSNGSETTIDYEKMIAIIKKHNYKGYIGIEFEGDSISEEEGIKKTLKLLEKYL